MTEPKAGCACVTCQAKTVLAPVTAFSVKLAAKTAEVTKAVRAWWAK